MTETPRCAADPQHDSVPKYASISDALNPKVFANVGGPSSEELFYQVGLATSMFEKIQDEVVQLFDQLCGGPFGRISPMGEIIGATSSFNVKMDLVTQAARSLIADENKQAAVLRWLKLATKASLVRNKIAHGRPVGVHFVVEGENRRGTFWAPSLFDTRKVGWPKISAEWDYCWNAEQIREYSSAFHLTSAMLMTVREQLAGVGEESIPSVLNLATM